MTMTYDHWKTTDPDAEFIGNAAQLGPTVPEMGGAYRGFVIWYDPPPIPPRDMDWHFISRNYDGAPDAPGGQYGHGDSAADCARQIDEYYEADLAADRQLFGRLDLSGEEA